MTDPVANIDGLERAVREILAEIDPEPDREGLVGTPRRVAGALRELTGGDRLDPLALIGEGLFEEVRKGAGDEIAEELVVVRAVPFFSLCEHHLLPFFGHAHIGYIPAGRVIGLSKIPRLLDLHCRRLQMQERLTREIAETLERVTGATGVGVVMEARHLCMEMRGVGRVGTETVTTSLLGALRDDAGRRAEFMGQVARRPAPD